MLRLFTGVSVTVRLSPTPKPRSSSSYPFFTSPSNSRSLYAPSGFLTRAFKASGSDMTEAVPQTRRLSEVEMDPSEGLASVGKKPRLDIEMERSEEQAVVSTSTAATTTTKQKPANGDKQPKKKRGSKRWKQRFLPPEPYSNDDVLWRDVRNLLGTEVADGIIEEGKEWESPFQNLEEVTVKVSAISSTGTALSKFIFPPARILNAVSFVSPGDGLAIARSPSNRPWVVVVPFALPGEVARVRMHQTRPLRTISSLLEIETPNHTLRDNSRIKCRYFGVCGGCQYQVRYVLPLLV